jgi:hypothetical protein
MKKKEEIGQGEEAPLMQSCALHFLARCISCCGFLADHLVAGFSGWFSMNRASTLSAP